MAPTIGLLFGSSASRRLDRDTVRFLCARERDGMALRNCPLYIRAWIRREEDQP
jgi:hypothetical protein